jgi:hypothetical protein
MPTLKPLGSLLNAPNYADRVNLIKKIKTASGWRFAPVVPEANGRLKDRVRINGQIEVHPAARPSSYAPSATASLPGPSRSRRLRPRRQSAMQSTPISGM